MSESPENAANFANSADFKKASGFEDVLRDGAYRFAEATAVRPVSAVRARGDRRRRGRITVSAVGAVAAVAGIAGVAFAGVPHRAAPPVRPAASTSAPPKGVAIAVRPGETVAAVFQDLTVRFGWTGAQLEAAVSVNTIDLPAWAKIDGRPTAEGMLEPGSYEARAADGPAALLRRMVDARIAVLDRTGFVEAAAGLRCGASACTPEQALTIASIAQAVDDDPGAFPGISEVVYARLRSGDVLAIDETAAYGLYPADGRHPPITAAQAMDLANPYSTGARRGLPPGPIGNPSDEALRAALAPTRDGDYFYCHPMDGRIEFFRKSQTADFEKACLRKAG